MPLLLWPALVLVLLTGCVFDGGDGSSRSVKYETSPYLVPCMSGGWFEAPSACVTGYWDGRATTTFHPGDLEGFEFQWNRSRTLQVERRPVKNPPQDGSSIRYVLVDVEEQPATPWDTAWEFNFTAYWIAARHLSGDTLHIPGYGRPVLVPDSTDRAAIVSLGRRQQVWMRVRNTASGLPEALQVSPLRNVMPGGSADGVDPW